MDKKYRIVKKYDEQQGCFYHTPERATHFLFLIIWRTIGSRAYRSLSSAMEVIEQHKEGKFQDPYKTNIVHEE